MARLLLKALVSCSECALCDELGFFCHTSAADCSQGRCREGSAKLQSIGLCHPKVCPGDEHLPSVVFHWTLLACSSFTKKGE